MKRLKFQEDKLKKDKNVKKYIFCDFFPIYLIKNLVIFDFNM